MINRLLLSAALYLGYYTALGAYMPFITLYYERMGLNGIQIGILASIPVLISTTTVMVWGGLADRFGWHSRIMRINLLLCAVSILLLSTAGSFQAIIPFIACYALFNSPLVPLLDSAALNAVEGSRYSYGQLRVWGSIGWSISTVGVGFIIQRFAIQWLFYSYAAFMLVTFFLSLWLPVHSAKLQTSLRAGLKNLVGYLPFVLFLVSVLFISMTLSAANAFLSIYLDEIGTNESSIGLAWAISSLSEIPIMFFSAYIVRKVGSGGLLKIAFFAFIVRWLLLSLIRTPVLALIVQVLHGITFGGYLIGSVTYINDRAAEGIRTTALAIFNLTGFGVGSILGSLLGGFVVEVGGTVWLFRMLSLVALAGFGVFLLSQKKSVLKVQVT
ncbi:MAG: major facilitator superfamily domain-containing protein 6 [Anaerolineales bacterium]|jgi:PPP family 3-phenylpropionic acid transporter